MQNSQNKANFWIGLVIVALATCYGLYNKYTLDRVGLITIARVEKFESAEQGGELYITIFYNRKEYKTVVNNFCSSCDKKFFFIKIFGSDPTKHPHFYENTPVPECILSKPLPRVGWKEIPVCGDEK